VTAHWIYLSRCLFHLSPDPRYIDEIEKALYNHLLGSQHPRTAFQSYYTPLMGHKEYYMQHVYGGPPPCCLSSVQRCIARTPEAVWTRFCDGGLGLLIYNPGTLKTHIASAQGPLGLDLEIQSEYPKDGEIEVILKPATPAKFRLALRVPAWTRRFEAKGPGGESWAGTPGRFLELERLWKPGDRIHIGMEMTCQRIPAGRNYPGHWAVKRGPQILAVGADVNPGLDFEKLQIETGGDLVLEEASDQLPSNWLGDQAYRSPAVKAGAAPQPLLAPFSDAGQIGNRDEYRVWLPAGLGPDPKEARPDR
jgi:hypothetical protein